MRFPCRVAFHQVIALMVAINTRSTSLMTILISNQFMEIKVRGAGLRPRPESGLPPRLHSDCPPRRCQHRLFQSSVFKRVDPASLFQITCSDLRERFQLMLVLAIIAVGANSLIMPRLAFFLF